MKRLLFGLILSTAWAQTPLPGPFAGGGDGAPSGAAGGSLGGTYPNPTIGTLGQNLLFTDATYDIGASGATRPRDIFTSRDVTVGRNLLVGPTVIAASNGAVLSTDISTPSNPSTGTTRLYAKGGVWCSLSPAGTENCLGSGSGANITLSNLGTVALNKPLLATMPIDSGNDILVITPADAVSNRTFGFRQQGFTNNGSAAGGRKDEVIAYGYNWGSNGARVSGNDVAFGFTIESMYIPGIASTAQTEFYYGYVGTDGTSWRPLGYAVSRDAQTDGWQFQTDNINLGPRAGGSNTFNVNGNTGTVTSSGNGNFSSGNLSATSFNLINGAIAPTISSSGTGNVLINGGSSTKVSLFDESSNSPALLKNATSLDIVLANGTSVYAPLHAGAITGTTGVFSGTGVSLSVTNTSTPGTGLLRVTGSGDSESHIILGIASAVNAASRNWGLFTNHTAYGDLNFTVSSANNTDPTTANKAILFSSGGFNLGGTVDPGAGIFRPNVGYQSSDGTAGATAACTVLSIATINFKNGLFTGCS